MNKHEAEKIVNEYGNTVASIPEGDLVQDVFSLPYSPGRIRYAIFAYTESLIKEKLFTDDIKKNLEMIYAAIDTKFVEEPRKLNRAWVAYKNNEKAREYIESRGGLTAFMPSTERMTEYHNFVAECYGNWVRAE